jgi:hypothetical protein
MNRTLTLLFLLVVVSFGTIRAQTPIVVVQAATPAPAAVVAATPPVADSNAALLQLLQQMKATNDETLKKQKVLLDQLDELQKAAEQMKVFSKRG